jgi:hypothetical protein
MNRTKIIVSYISTMFASFYQSGPRILRTVLVHTCKNSFPICGPNCLPGGHDFNKLDFVLCEKTRFLAQ